MQITAAGTFETARIRVFTGPQTPVATDNEPMTARSAEAVDGDRHHGHDHGVHRAHGRRGHHGHHGHGHEVRRAVKQISRSVREGLRDLADQLSTSEPGDVSETQDGPTQTVEPENGSQSPLRDTLEDLGHDFHHELRDAFRDMRSEHGLDAHALLSAVDSAFEHLITGVQAALQTALQTEAPVVGEESGEGGEDGEATTPTADEVSPAPSSAEETAPNQTEAEPETETEAKAETIDLSSLLERFQSSLARLQSLFAPRSLESGPAGGPSFSFSLNVTTIRLDVVI